jgi:hypothetical protein
MNEAQQIIPSDNKQKRIWSKPKLISGKDFLFYGMVQSTTTGPNGTPPS